VPPDTLWRSLLPQLGLAEPPEPVGSRVVGDLRWDLYAFETRGLAIDAAVAERDASTYLVLTQAPPSERDAIREDVFEPAVEAFEVLEPEASVDPEALPYDQAEVRFTGGDADATLAGTLTTPRTPGPHPGVVLFSGSGPQDRDESLAPVAAIKPFAILADALTRAGLAVLRYDDRGTARSTGDYAAATLEDFTADAGAALSWLREQPLIDPDRVGVLGHSEGGLYIASLLEGGETPAFVVGLAVPAVPGIDLMVAQNAAVIGSSGGSAQDVEEVESFARRLFEAVLEGDHATATGIASEYYGRFYDTRPPGVQTALGDREAWVTAQVETLLATITAPAYLGLLRSDPRPGWDVAAMPVLAIFGGRDTQVIAAQNAPALEDALARGDPTSLVVTLPDANHLFQSAETGSPVEYGSLDDVFTPDLLPLLTAWLADRLDLPTPP
jgi:dienelactone hydrolase